MSTTGEEAAGHRILGAGNIVVASGEVRAVSVAILTGVEVSVAAGGRAIGIRICDTATTTPVVAINTLGKFSINTLDVAPISLKGPGLTHRPIAAAFGAVAIT